VHNFFVGESKSMNIKKIKECIIKFRKATDDAFEYGAFGQDYPFSNFPHECCDDMCDLLGQFLIEKGLVIFKVHGTYRMDCWANQYSHVWLILEDGMIIDLTGDQYKNDPNMLNYDIPCYMGKKNNLYNLFSEEQETYPYHGIDDYSDVETRKRLWRLYNIILSFYTK